MEVKVNYQCTDCQAENFKTKLELARHILEFTSLTHPRLRMWALGIVKGVNTK
jgi:hypothetical protein